MEFLYVTIKEELEFAKDYITLLQLRFENSIQYENLIDVESLNKKTVPLSLQLLLEKCIKHNKISEEQPLRIRIYDEPHMLVVEKKLGRKIKSLRIYKNRIAKYPRPILTYELERYSYYKTSRQVYC